MGGHGASWRVGVRGVLLARHKKKKRWCGAKWPGCLQGKGGHRFPRHAEECQKVDRPGDRSTGQATHLEVGAELTKWKQAPAAGGLLAGGGQRGGKNGAQQQVVKCWRVRGDRRGSARCNRPLHTSALLVGDFSLLPCLPRHAADGQGFWEGAGSATHKASNPSNESYHRDTPAREHVPS